MSAYDRLPEDVKKTFDPVIEANRSRGPSTLVRLLAVLSRPNGWMGYNWSANEISPERFVRERGY